MSPIRESRVAIVLTLGIAATAVPGGALSVADAQCSPWVAPAAAAVPGGDGALAASQPGPPPAGEPGRCWFAPVPLLIGAPDAVLVDPVVAVADDAGEVVAIGTADGSEAWRYSVADPGEGQVHGVAAGDGAVYVAGPEGLTALEATDGTRRWRYRVRSETLVADTSGVFWPVAQGDTVYGLAYSTEDDATWDRRLVALDAVTGDERWTAPVALVGPGPSSDGSIVAVAPGDGSVASFDARTGTRLWTTDPAVVGWAVAMRPAIGAGRVIVGSSDGNAVALDAASGAVAWRYPVEGGAIASVSLAGSTVLVAGGVTLTALDAVSGTPRWSVSVQQSPPMMAMASIPAVVDDTIVIGTTDMTDVTRILALDLTMGAERWRVDTEAYGAAFSPLVAGSRVHVPLLDFGGGSGLISLGG